MGGACNAGAQLWLRERGQCHPDRGAHDRGMVQQLCKRVVHVLQGHVRQATCMAQHAYVYTSG